MAINKARDLLINWLLVREHCTAAGESVAVPPLVFQDSRDRLLRAGKLSKLLILAQERLRRWHSPRPTMRGLNFVRN
jgi:hypothetical protein